MARCSSCNKFVGNEQADPEVSDVSIDGDEVRVQVRIVNNCAECGSELTGADLDCSTEFEKPEGWRDEAVECTACEGTGLAAEASCTACDGAGQLDAHDPLSFEVEESSSESTCRTEGRGRGTRTFYGATVTCTVTHPEFPDWSTAVDVSVEERASAMELLT